MQQYRDDTSLSYQERAYKRIKQSIISRDLPPGQIINERKLARELNVSRTPVRKAIHELQEEGWLLVKPWRGAVILPITRRDVIEVTQLRLALESLVVELAVNYIGQKETAYLEGIVEKQRRMADDPSPEAGQFAALDKEFHFFLARLSDNGRLTRIMRLFGDTHMRMNMETLQSKNRFHTVVAEHATIVKALAKRDVSAARGAMILHIIGAREALLYRSGTASPQVREVA